MLHGCFPSIKNGAKNTTVYGFLAAEAAKTERGMVGGGSRNLTVYYDYKVHFVFYLFYVSITLPDCCSA